MKHVLCILALWAAGLGSALLANNIAVSNVTITGQNTSSGVNHANNYTAVKFNLDWENSWRINGTSGGLSYMGLKSGGANYSTAPNVFIGSQGAVAWQASTSVLRGALLVVSASPNRYYRVATTHITEGTAPSHTSGQTASLEFVSVSDGGGSGATATASVSSGAVTGISITAAGSGYTSVPSLHIFRTNAGPASNNATADAYISSWWDAAWVFVKFRVGASNPTFTGVTLTNASNTVTLPSVTNLRVGMPLRIISGSSTLTAGTVITAINTSTNVVTLSNNATTTASNNALEFIRIWEHASLSATAAHHTAPAGSTIDAPSDSMGVFIYRNGNGTGNFSLSDVQLRWAYGTNGVRDDAVVQVQVFAIEMVWVPQGSFVVGSPSGGNLTSEIYTHTTNVPFQISSENQITVGTSSGNLYYNSSANGGDRAGPIPAAFPKGHAGFYCMKYEISQGDYRDFLNTLTYTQQTSRAVSVTGSAGTAALDNSNRNGIDIQTPGVAASFTPAVYACNLTAAAPYDTTDDGEWIACNHISWMDGCAYVDWAGLRPMTELEYEKACRGIQAAVSSEYAWGTASITGATGISNSGANNETFSNAGANCAYNNNGSVQGPLRVGAFAGGATTRLQAGASYYGIMELSGNLWESVVTIGNIAGRAFTGLNGNGQLSPNGHANQSNWPGISSNEVTGDTGSGYRGGNWFYLQSSPRVSDRAFATGAVNIRSSLLGFRGVRVFP